MGVCLFHTRHKAERQLRLTVGTGEGTWLGTGVGATVGNAVGAIVGAGMDVAATEGGHTTVRCLTLLFDRHHALMTPRKTVGRAEREQSKASNMGLA